MDADGTPLALRTTAANVPDGRLALPLLDAIPPVAGSRGRPRFRPLIYQGDAAYGWESNIAGTLVRGVAPWLSQPGGEHGSGLGITRYVVERTLAWFNHFRRLRLCYEKCGEHLQAFHELASALICFNKCSLLGV